MRFHLAFGLVVMTIVGVSKARGPGKVGEPCSFGFYEWLSSGFSVAVGERGFVGVACFRLGDLSLSGGWVYVEAQVVG